MLGGCCALVGALFGEHRQLLVGRALFLQRGFQQRDRLDVAELFRQRAKRPVRGDLVVLDLLRAADQCRIAQRAFLDVLDDIVAFLRSGLPWRLT